MLFLREHVGTIYFNADRDTTFAKLLAALQSLSLVVDKADKDKTRVTVRCLTQAVNLIFWRCSSDKLQFDVHTSSNGGAIVNVYAVPNPFRMSVPKSANISDVGHIVVAVREALRH
jgi:hypothetical protein